jgi:hypothetical protein
MKALEEIFNHALNHTHVKGLDEHAKRATFGEFLAETPKSFTALRFDKKANDRTWTSYHWDLIVRKVAEWTFATGFDFWQNTHMYTADELDEPVRLAREGPDRQGGGQVRDVAQLCFRLKSGLPGAREVPHTYENAAHEGPSARRAEVRHRMRHLPEPPEGPIKSGSTIEQHRVRVGRGD